MNRATCELVYSFTEIGLMNDESFGGESWRAETGANGEAGARTADSNKYYDRRLGGLWREDMGVSGGSAGQGGLA